MKNILLLFFLFLFISSSAQKNELITAYQIVSDENLGKGLSFSYYRDAANHKAMGLKLFYNEANNSYTNTPLKAIGLDAVHRWNFSKRQKVRLMAETGIAALKTYNESPRDDFLCDCIFVPNALSFIPVGEPRGYLYLGFTAGITIDFQLLKLMKFGVGFTHTDYLTNEKEINKGVSRSSLHINVGVKF